MRYPCEVNHSSDAAFFEGIDFSNRSEINYLYNDTESIFLNQYFAITNSAILGFSKLYNAI